MERAGANFSLQSGQSFEAVGNDAGVINPFAVTENIVGISNVPVAATLNAGVSTLTATFDRNGFANAVNSASMLATPSLADQAGVIQLGGNAPTANVTTATIPTPAGGNIKAGLSLGIVPWALLEHLLECLPMG